MERSNGPTVWQAVNLIIQISQILFNRLFWQSPCWTFVETWHGTQLCTQPKLRTKDAFIAPMSPSSGEWKGLDEKSLEKSTSNLHPKSLTWNLKNYDFKKYNFFFWGDNFSIGQMLVFVGYISVSIVIDLAALPPHLQGRCYRQWKTHRNSMSEHSFCFKTQAKGKLQVEVWN